MKEILYGDDFRLQFKSFQLNRTSVCKVNKPIGKIETISVHFESENTLLLHVVLKREWNDNNNNKECDGDGEEANEKTSIWLEILSNFSFIPPLLMKKKSLSVYKLACTP